MLKFIFIDDFRLIVMYPDKLHNEWISFKGNMWAQYCTNGQDYAIGESFCHQLEVDTC